MDQPNPKKLHFAKLNERIQSRYERMMWRLEKSRSVDSLTAADYDRIYKDKPHNSKTDNTDLDEEIQQLVKHSIVMEDIEKDARIEEIDLGEESVVEIVDSELFDIDSHESGFEFVINEDKHQSYVQNECKQYNEYIAPPVPPPRISIRNKIGSRITAAKEKRRQEEKERMATKDKKKESREKVEKFVLSNNHKGTDRGVRSRKTKIATITVALIEATGFEHSTEEKQQSRNVYCRFRLGMEKHKSKSARSNASAVKWQELFNLNIYEETENILEISMWDKDLFLGRTILNLFETEREKTHQFRRTLESESKNYEVFFLLTISGFALDNALVDSDDYQKTMQRLESVHSKFAWYHLKDDFTDVGWLSAIVYGARGLSSHDNYCVLELGNERRQSHTEYKTNDPTWMKVFTFIVTDVTSILEITLYDEKKFEEVGKISLPLLYIENGQKRWYTLKDSTQRDMARGNDPKILVEMRITWNLIKASARVINPKEFKYIDVDNKFDRRVFARNIARAKAVTSWVLEAFRVLKTCFEWESTRANFVALNIWLLFCWHFKVWMLPLLLLIPFVRYRPNKYYLVNWRRFTFGKTAEVEAHEKSLDEKTSLRQKIQSLQEMIQAVQNSIGKFASLGEQFKNLCNFTVPFLSCLAIFMILVVTIFMYLIPTQYIFMCWGIHKFTRKILRPNRIPNNEILDLLSRVPDDEILLDCKELPVKEEISE